MNTHPSSSPFSTQPNDGEIERELEPGEKLLWSGRPDSSIWERERWRTLGNHLAVTAFSLLWLGGTSQMLFQEWRDGRTPELITFCFPVIGLFALGGAVRDWLRSEGGRASRTFYGVTDRRALIVIAGKEREVRSFLPHQIQLGRREGDGNLGDVLLNDARILEKEKPPTSFRLHKPQKSDEELELEIAFVSIENPREVETIIRQKLLAFSPN